MKLTLKQGVQQHLDKKELSTKQLQQLLAIQKNHQKKSEKAYFLKYALATVASVLMLSIVLSQVYFTNAFHKTQSIEQLIAEEVAGNHLKLKPLEVSSNKMLEISSFFKQLNFSPVSPTTFSISKQTLLGGRYCSIQGVTALQLRLINIKTNKVQSLYETEYDKQVFKEFPKLGEGGTPLTIYVKGMKVEMWVEKDILFALIE